MNYIDVAVLDKIKALQRPGAPDIVGCIVGLFLVDTPKGVKAIIEARENRDFDVARNAAHTLKTSAAYVGAMSFSEKMAAIEYAARNEDFDDLQQQTENIEELSQCVLAELHDLQSKAA